MKKATLCLYLELFLIKKTFQKRIFHVKIIQNKANFTCFSQYNYNKERQTKFANET